MTSRKFNLLLSLFVVLFFLFSLTAGCSSQKVIQEKEENQLQTEADARENLPAQSSEEVKTGGEPKTVDPTRCLLCGRTVSRHEIFKRPIAVMIENHPKARPQSGLDEADIVYEMPVEGGISRFMAIYLHSDKSRIGPVRSSRPYYLDKLLEYEGIYVYFGGSPQAWEDIARLKIEGINGIYDGLTFWRDESRKKPHNAYTSIKKIKRTSEMKGYDRDVNFKHFKFCEGEEVPEGEKAETVILKFSPFKYTVKYEYNKHKGGYLRYMDNKPHIDRETHKQLSAENIIIQKAKTMVIPGDDAGRLNIQLVGKGEGYYISKGNCIKITWEKKSRKGYTYFYDTKNKEITLNPGTTWIQIVPYNAEVQIQ